MNYTLFNFMNTSHELYLMIVLIFFMRLMLDTCSSGDGSSFLASWRGSWDDPHKSRAARTRAQATMLGVWVGSGDLWRAGTSGATEDELWSLPLAFVSTELCFQSPGSSFFLGAPSISGLTAWVFNFQRASTTRTSRTVATASCSTGPRMKRRATPCILSASSLHELMGSCFVHYDHT